MSETQKPTPTGTSATAVTLAKSDQNLIWLDCEMSGLDPERERLLEIAVVITNADLSVRVESPVFVIHQTDAVLDGMDAWNKGTHGRSGLIDKVKASQDDEASVEAALLTFIKRYVPKAGSPMCGNTISQDRRFLVKYMPKFESYFHYRCLCLACFSTNSLRFSSACCLAAFTLSSILSAASFLFASAA